MKNLKFKGDILKNGVHCNVVETVKENDKLILKPYEKENDNIVPVNILIEIVYETDDICVVNKPKNMPTHPSLGHYEDTVLNALSYVWKSRGENHVIRPINRLDRNTTGLMLVAKTQYAAKLLTDQLIGKRIQKRYIAIIRGHLNPLKGDVEAPIDRENESLIKRCVSPDGKPSHTKYEVEKRGDNADLVHLYPITGRTHQLRVHMSYLGHPLLGDELYGDSGWEKYIDRFALHCDELIFEDPMTCEKMIFCTKMPYDMESAWVKLNKKSQ